MNDELRKKIDSTADEYVDYVLQVTNKGKMFEMGPANNEHVLDHAFKAGAEYGAKIAFEKAVETLNSKEAHEFQRSFKSFINVARWKCWLEEKGKELGILPKDEEC